MFQRTSGAQLPDAKELFAILRDESQRKAVRYDFVAIHARIFDAYRQLTAKADADDSWIDTYPQLSLEELLPQIDKNQAQLKDFISHHPQLQELYKAVYRGLMLEDDLSKSDAIFVFGALSNARIERAVELYTEGVAGKIIISGHRPFYATNQESEAQRMANYAIANGVPRGALILEEKSITLPDNVKKTLDLFDGLGWKPQSITFVITNYAMVRAYMEWYKFTPWNIDIKPVAARQQSPYFSPENWYKDEHTTALVLNEYIKLIIESKIDLIRRDNNSLLAAT